MINGVINLLKPPGMTSHDAVAFVRRTYGLKQVGHAGTLDPAAAGVLPVFLGRATRLVEYLADADKEYRAEILFGQETDSGDDTGVIIRTAETIPTSDILNKVLHSFLGESLQVPPMHSAVKIGGRKLYELARQGITVERQARTIAIHAIKLLSCQGSTALFDVACSKGTYIRTLCADIGVRCGSAAVMTFLLRTKVGCFDLIDAASLEEIAKDPASALLPADTALFSMPSIVLTEAETKSFLNGRRICLQSREQRYKIYCPANTFIGIGRASNNLLIPEKVFPPQELSNIKE